MTVAEAAANDWQLSSGEMGGVKIRGEGRSKNAGRRGEKRDEKRECQEEREEELLFSTPPTPKTTIADREEKKRRSVGMKGKKE